MKKQPLIILTPGDPDGIGPEITVKAYKKLEDNQRNIIVIGSIKPFKKLRANLNILSPEDLRRGIQPLREAEGKLSIYPVPEKAPEDRFLQGYQSGWAVQTAVQMIKQGLADALVTGPISKERLQKGGYKFSGHTELLAKLTSEKSVTMMLSNENLSVSLVTTHLPLKSVPRHITEDNIIASVMNTYSYLKNDLRIPKPKIALTGLNPHAGENGILGKEEIECIEPAIKKLKNKLGTNCSLAGPYPADTLFAKQMGMDRKRKFHAIVAMYHDQGLTPVKMADFRNTINITLGLPIIRTSVDHGTAFDIVGKNMADPSSLIAAIKHAHFWVTRKKS